MPKNKRPVLADVSNWGPSDEFSNEHAEVTTGDLMYQGQLWRDGAYAVKDRTTGKRKVFYGESAWSDAQRLANDLYWAHR